MSQNLTLNLLCGNAFSWLPALTMQNLRLSCQAPERSRLHMPMRSKSREGVLSEEGVPEQT